MKGSNVILFVGQLFLLNSKNGTIKTKGLWDDRKSRGSASILSYASYRIARMPFSPRILICSMVAYTLFYCINITSCYDYLTLSKSSAQLR